MSNKNSILSELPVHLEITGGFLLLCAVTGFFCGGAAFCAAALAAAVHEWGHLAVMLWQGCIPTALRLDASGACLRCMEEPSYRQELWRALAGPLAGLVLWAALRGSGNPFLKSTAGMSFLLSAVNLLPGEGLDGGRALQSLSWRLFRPEQAELLPRMIGWVTAAGCFLMGLRHAPQLGLYGFWLLLRSAGIGMND